MPPTSSPILLYSCLGRRLALQESCTVAVTSTTSIATKCLGIDEAVCAGASGDSTAENGAEPGLQPR